MQSLRLLEDYPDIEKLLVQFALFALNYERLIDQVSQLCKSISPETPEKERTGGGWIHLAKKLCLNNLNLNEADKEIIEKIFAKLWEINTARINTLKGVKIFLYQKGVGASLLAKQQVEDRQGEAIKLDEIANRTIESQKLSFVFEIGLIPAVTNKIHFSQVVTEDSGNFTVNLHHLS